MMTENINIVLDAGTTWSKIVEKSTIFNYKFSILLVVECEKCHSTVVFLSVDGS